MRSVVSTSTVALTILTLSGVADPLPPIYDRGLAYSPSTYHCPSPGQVDTTAAEEADRLRVNGTRRPSWSVNVEPPRYPNVIGRRGRSLFISDADTRYGVDDAPSSRERQHRDQRWSKRASAVGAVTGRLVFMVSLIRQFV